MSGIDWHVRAVAASNLPRLDPAYLPDGWTGPDVAAIAVQRDCYVRFAPTDAEVDGRVYELQSVVDPVRVLAIVAPWEVKR